MCLTTMIGRVLDTENNTRKSMQCVVPALQRLRIRVLVADWSVWKNNPTMHIYVHALIQKHVQLVERHRNWTHLKFWKGSTFFYIYIILDWLVQFNDKLCVNSQIINRYEEMKMIAKPPTGRSEADKMSLHLYDKWYRTGRWHLMKELCFSEGPLSYS